MYRPSKFSDEKKAMIRAKSAGLCFYCGCMLEYQTKKVGPRHATYDHIIPLSKGGRHTIENLVLSCADCNNKKQNLSLDEYRVIRGGFFAERFGFTATEIVLTSTQVHAFCKKLNKALDDPNHKLWQTTET